MSFRGKGQNRTLLPFGLDYSDVLSTDYDVEKPKIILPINAPLNDQETIQAKQSINMSKLIYDGPFYIGSGESKVTTDGIERHSDKYKKVKKVGTTIDEHPYNLSFFPQELHSVMGVSKSKKLGLSSYKTNGGINQFEIIDTVEKLNNMADDLDTNEEPKEHEEEEEEEVEDEFDDDEDDDYNAEKYFDDGNDDYGDNDDNEEAEF